MSVAMHWQAALALLPLTLAACVSPPPPPVEAGHPAHPDTPAATAASVTTLQTYRDFGKPRADASPAPENNHAQPH